MSTLLPQTDTAPLNGQAHAARAARAGVVIRIRPSGPWTPLNVRDLWAYRELLYFLTWRDLKVRYRQTLLGVAWALIQPLAAMLLFTLFFGTLAKMPSDGIPYPVFVYAGLLPWLFFSSAVTNSGNSLVGSANLISKVWFPRLLIPASAVCAALVDFAISFALLVGLMFYFVSRGEAQPPGWNILLLPVLVLLTGLLALGVGLWLSALNVKYRDIRHALPFLIQLWMFATPIIYPASLVPEGWRWVLALNPLAGIIEGYRAALFELPIDWLSLGVSSLVTVLLLVAAAYAFRRMEKSFADII